MIHVALVVAAMLFVGWVTLLAAGLIAEAFEVHFGCGVFALMVALIIAAAILVFTL
jgi:hypothetical protein